MGVDAYVVCSCIKDVPGCGFDADVSGAGVDESDGDTLIGVIPDISIGGRGTGAINHRDRSGDRSDKDCSGSGIHRQIAACILIDTVLRGHTDGSIGTGDSVIEDHIASSRSGV